jgi:hypothetical protein
MNDLITGTIVLSLILMPVVAWFTHVIHCINHEMWGFLIAGAIMFPIAIIHGIMIWFS